MTGSVVMQHPSVGSMAGNSDFFFRVVQGPHVGTFNCVYFRHEFLTNSTLTVVKTKLRGFDFRFAHAFLGCGELLVCHSEQCRLVSGSY